MRSARVEAFNDGGFRPTTAQCRGGGSATKPFCDGTHWYIKFHDDKH